MKQKDTSVPSGTIEKLVVHTRLSDCQHSSIVPSGTDSSLKTLTQHFVLGYFRQVPAGLIFSNHQSSLMLTLMGSCRTATEDYAGERLHPGSTSSIRSHETLSRIAFPRCDR